MRMRGGGKEGCLRESRSGGNSGRAQRGPRRQEEGAVGSGWMCRMRERVVCCAVNTRGGVKRAEGRGDEDGYG